MSRWRSPGRQAILGYMTNPKVGDLYAIDHTQRADCPATHTDGRPWTAFCVLSAEHEGQHLALDEDGLVVEVWD